MNPEDKTLKEMNYEGSNYKTLFTGKFLSRKAYEPEDLTRITALIPGTILKVLVKEGQQVNPSKCLFILEAMKMRNKVFPLTSGFIKKIHIKEGQIVTKNQLLLELGEPDTDLKKSRKVEEPVKEKRKKRFGRKKKTDTSAQ